MKIVIFSLLISILLCSQASSREITFLWTANITNTTEYKLYRDAEYLETILGRETEIVTIEEDDKGHTYYLTAFNDINNLESISSSTVILLAVGARREVGFFWTANLDNATEYRLYRDTIYMATILGITNSNITILEDRFSHEYYLTAYNSVTILESNPSSLVLINNALPDTPLNFRKL